MPDTTIARVETLALAEGQPLIQEESGLVVEWWRPDHPIDTVEQYDRDYRPPSNIEENLVLPRDCNPILDSYRPHCTRR